MNKVMYWVGAAATFFPVFFLPLPWWGCALIIIGVYLLSMFTPILSTIIQAVLWIIGLVFIITKPNDSRVLPVAVFAFVFWLFMNIMFFKAMFSNKR